MIRAILFDLDCTLVDRDAAFLACVRATFGDSPSAELIVALDASGHGDRTTLLQVWQLHSGEALTLDALGARIASRLQPSPDLIAALHDLAARIRIGVITNGGSRAQRLKLEAAGFNEVFPPNLVFVFDVSRLAGRRWRNHSQREQNNKAINSLLHCCVVSMSNHNEDT